MTGGDIRAMLLTIIAERKGEGPLQADSVLQEAARRLGIRRDPEAEQQLLTLWGDLFRTGYLGWGYNLANPWPPFCHVTEAGRRALENLSRDPANPDGYLAYLDDIAELDDVATSYLREALAAFNAGLVKAAAVMVGGAAEHLVLSLRDAVSLSIRTLNHEEPAGLDDWRIKPVLNALEGYFDRERKNLPRQLYDRFRSYWPAFTQQIRAVRNDAGHPTTVEPIDHPTVHASLLIFPELAALQTDLLEWVTERGN